MTAMAQIITHIVHRQAIADGNALAHRINGEQEIVSPVGVHQHLQDTQAPFITIFMNVDEPDDEQTRDDLALIIRVMLEQRILGVKDASGQYIAPAFPKLIYALV